MTYDGQEKIRAATGIQDVFVAYGEAAYRIQLMEYDLVSIWMIDSVTQGVSVDKQDLLRFQEDWGSKSFGMLLKPLLKSDLTSIEIRGFLEEVRVTRNRIVHRYFLDNAKDLLTNDGRQSALYELWRMSKEIQKAQEFFSGVLESYLKDFGVDVQSIREQVLADAESGG